MSRAHLEVRDLEVNYGGVRALNGISFSVPHRGLTAIVGANALARPPWSGQWPAWSARRVAAFFSKEPTSPVGISETCELGIGQVAEGRQIFPNLTVEENLRLGGALRRCAGTYGANRSQVFEMFPRLQERSKQKAEKSVRRRAANARNWPLPDEQSKPYHVRRAIAGTRSAYG